MKLTGLVAKVVAADAEYFRNNDFITWELYQSVIDWLETGNTCDAQSTAAEWLESDAEYFKELARALIYHHWYMAPLMAAMVFFVPRALHKISLKLRSEYS